MHSGQNGALGAGLRWRNARDWHGGLMQPQRPGSAQFPARKAHGPAPRARLRFRLLCCCQWQVRSRRCGSPRQWAHWPGARRRCGLIRKAGPPAQARKSPIPDSADSTWPGNREGIRDSRLGRGQETPRSRFGRERETGPRLAANRRPLPGEHSRLSWVLQMQLSASRSGPNLT
jgi:hypothetical protein